MPACIKTNPRVQQWPFLGSPLPLVSIIVAYLYIVLVAGPKFMENRKPHSLKKIIAAYNIFQLFANSFIIYGLLTSGWANHLDFGCHLPDFSNHPTALRGFFILRKKESQRSFLHLYHHVSTLLIVYLSAKYLPGGSVTFPMILNAMVHVLMYTYYLLTLMGPRMQRRINKVQFVIVLLYSMQMFNPDCKIPTIIPYVFVPNVLLVFYLFYDFYQKAYKSKKD
uniref:Elongation of very long chain fatty acids protein n=1 Tax=Timema shepardi TaxID=629360 RepID=A0A7R9FZ43_TIMSH|nr:unnamed protein product [Timema shepardi]